MYSPIIGIDALVQLARLASEPHRSAVLEYFVDGVFGQPWGPDTRAEAIVAVSDLLQLDFIDQCVVQIVQHALDDVLHAVTQSADGNHVGRPESLAHTLHILAPLLIPERAASFLELADEVPDESWRMAARIAVGPCLAEPERTAVVDEALATAKELDVNDDSPSTNLWRPLVWLGRLVTGTNRRMVGNRALAAASSIGMAWQTGAGAGVAEILENPWRDMIVAGILESDKGYSIAKVLPYLDNERAWEAARHVAISTIAWTPGVTDELATTLVNGEPEQRLELWQEATSKLRNLKRSDLCARYAALSPLLRSLEERHGEEQLAASMMITAGWWA
jgi:hypothetical protein